MQSHFEGVELVAIVAGAMIALGGDVAVAKFAGIAFVASAADTDSVV